MTIVVKTVSESSLARKDLAKLETSVAGIESSVQRATATFSKFGAGLAASLALAGTVKQMMLMSDTMTNLENKIKSVTDTQQKFNKAFQGVKDIAVATRSDLNATASLYQRIAINQKEIGISTRSSLRVVEIVSKALKVSGTAADEARSAMLQFGQAIGSGRLQGDELRSLGENAPIIMKAIADSLGAPVSALKKMGEEGKLVNAVILPGILKAGEEIDKKFGGLKVTFGDAFQSIKTGSVILKDAVSKYFFGSKNAIADWINSVGQGMARFGKYFEVYMTFAKNKVAMFAIEAILLFDAVLPAAKEMAAVLLNGVVGLYKKWQPELKKVLDVVSGWAVAVKEKAAGFYQGLLDSLSGNELFQQVKQVISVVRDQIVGAFKSLLVNLNIDLPEIDVSKFFAKLTPVKTLVLDFVKAIERAFFWLYDRIIGHSWVPDLVDGIKSWFNKLLGEPLAAVKKFTSTIDKRFAAMSVGAVLILWSLYMRRFKTAIALVVGGLGALYAMVPKIKATDALDEHSKTLDSLGDTTETLQDKTKKLYGTLSKGFNKVGFNGKDAEDDKPKTVAPIGTLTIAQKLAKSITSLKDAVLPKKEKSDKPEVGSNSEKTVSHKKTAKELSEEKSIIKSFSPVAKAVKNTTEAPKTLIERMQDTVNNIKNNSKESKPNIVGTFLSDISEKLKIPLAIVVTGAMILGVLAAFKSNTVRAALISLGTTAIAGFTIAHTKKGDVEEAAGWFGRKALTLISDGLSSFLGGNALFNPKGLLLLIAKMALLFKAGREVIGNALKAVAVAPTKIGQNIGLAQDRRFAQQEVNKIKKEAEALTRNRRANVVEAGRDYAKNLRNLQSMVVNGRSLSQANINEAINTGRINTPGMTPQQQQAARSAMLSGRDYREQQRQYNNRGVDRSNLESRADRFRARIAELDKQKEERRANLREGTRSAFAGVGGAVAGVAGFQLGTEFTKSMTGSPEWLKLSVQVGTAMAAQFAGAAAMSLLFASLLAVFTSGGAAAASLLKGGMTLAAKASGAILSSAFVTGGSLLGKAITLTFGAAGLLANPLVLLVAGIVGAFTIGYLLLQKLPESWKEGMKGFFEDRYTQGTSSQALTAKNDPAGWKATAERIAKERDGDGWFTSALKSNQRRMGRFFFGVSETTAAMEASIAQVQKVNREAKKATNNSVKTPTKIKNDFSSSFVDLPENNLQKLLKSKNSGGSQFDIADLKTLTSTAPNTEKPEFLKTVFTDVKKIASSLPGGETLVKSLENMATPAPTVVPPKPPTIVPPGDFAPTPVVDTAESIKSVLDNLNLDTDKGSRTFDGAVMKAAEVAGLTEIHQKDIEFIRNSGKADSVDMLSRLTSEIAYFASVVKQKPGTTVARIAQGRLDESKASMAGLVAKEAFGDDEKDNFRKDALEEKSKQKKVSAITLRDQFDLITTTFPKLGLELSEFERITDTTREAIYKNAKDIASKENELNNKIIGIVDKSRSAGKSKTGATIAVESQKEREALALSRKEGLANSFAALNPERTFQKRVGVAFGNAGFGDVEKLARFASQDVADKYEPQLTQLENIRESLQLPTTANRQELEEYVDTLVKQISEGIERDTIDVLKGYDEVTAVGSKIGVSIDRGTFNKIVGGDLEIVRKALLEAFDLQIKANANQGNAEGARLQSAADQSILQIQEMLDKFKAPSIAFKTEVAGKGFAQTVSSDFSSAFTDALKGKTDGKHGVIKSFVLTFVDRFTNTVVETFSKGLMEAVLGEGTTAFGWLKNIGKGLFKDGSDVGGGADPVTGQVLGAVAGSADDFAKKAAGGDDKGGLTGLLSDPLEFLKTSLTDGIKWLGEAFTGIFDNIGPMVAGLGKFIGKIGSGIMSIFGFAEGGYVSGRGTGTSDSIPAMLSNGEFVVNAKATKKFAPLLSSINSGSFGKFAGGGMVSTNIAEAPSFADIKPGNTVNSSKEQIFNINITGDISRQTKQEIFGMLPAIATGVNGYNRERGM